MSCRYATDRDRDEDRKFKCAFEDKWSGRKSLLHKACVMHYVHSSCVNSSFLCYNYTKGYKYDLFDICRKCLKIMAEVN